MADLLISGIFTGIGFGIGIAPIAFIIYVAFFMPLSK